MPPSTEAAIERAAAGAELRHWWLAARPRTLSIAVVPVLLGSALAWAHTGTLLAVPMLAALVAAVLIQLGTNLHNDAADFERGADDPSTRLGPPRASAEGWLPATAVRRAAQVCFAGAFLLGGYLVWAAGLVILAIGVASIAAGWAYSGGPKPVSYTALGEVFVFVFFGLAAVIGSYFLQTGVIDPAALLAGAVIGMPAAAVLVVNNLRDIDEDRRAGRRTVAVLLGRRASCVEYTALLVLPFALLPLVDPALASVGWGWLPWLVAPFAVRLALRLWRQPAGAGLNGVLADTARLQAGLGLALCAALVGLHAGL